MTGAERSPNRVAGHGLGTYPVLFLDDEGVPITPLNEWYRAAADGVPPNDISYLDALSV